MFKGRHIEVRSQPACSPITPRASQGTTPLYSPSHLAGPPVSSQEMLLISSRGWPVQEADVRSRGYTTGGKNTPGVRCSVSTEQEQSPAETSEERRREAFFWHPGLSQKRRVINASVPHANCLHLDEQKTDCPL